MNFEQIKDILVEQAKAEGLEEYEIYFSNSNSVSAETLENEISSFSGGASAGVSFRCVVDGRIGNASTELFEENELVTLVSRAKSNAMVIESDNPAIIFGGSEKYESAERSEFKMPETAFVKELALEIQ
ncbi:MAG: hypothetical protein J6U86_05485, partial [Clostridia bacterium]|nr:hypothetical protein [Clostridia bacterium]